MTDTALKAASDWIGIVTAVLSWAILPAFEALRRFWFLFKGLLAAVRVFANRDRRTIDLTRRLSFVMSGDEKHPGLLPALRIELQRQGAPPATMKHLEELHAQFMEIHRQADWLRDTAYGCEELEKQRAAGRKGEAIFQGDLDARRLHVLTTGKG
jgi:hypothetical protein